MLVGAVTAEWDGDVFAGEILVVIFGWVVGTAAEPVEEPPVMWVVIMPPPVCGTRVPAMLVGAVDEAPWVAVFAGEILVVMPPGLLGVGDGTWAWTSGEDCIALNTAAMAKRRLRTKCGV